MRITRPLIGAAAGAGALGAALAFGLTAASAGTGSSAASHSSSGTTAAVRAVTSPPASPAKTRPAGTHKCPAGAHRGMPDGSRMPTASQPGPGGAGGSYQ